MDLVRDPRVHLSILVQNAFGADKASGVKDRTAVFFIDLEHRSGLDINIVFLRLLRDAVRVFVRDLDGEFFDQFGGRCKNRSGVSELGKTTSRTGRNGALPATAESIIETMRSVLRRISERSTGSDCLFGMQQPNI